MNDDQLTDLIIKLSTGIAELNANMRTALDALAKHESRLTMLESRGGNANGDWKVQLLMLLAKAILIGAVSIGSLVGAGSLMKSVVGDNCGSIGSSSSSPSTVSNASTVQHPTD